MRTRGRLQVRERRAGSARGAGRGRGVPGHQPVHPVSDSQARSGGCICEKANGEKMNRSAFFARDVKPVVSAKPRGATGDFLQLSPHTRAARARVCRVSPCARTLGGIKTHYLTLNSQNIGPNDKPRTRRQGGSDLCVASSVGASAHRSSSGSQPSSSGSHSGFTFTQARRSFRAMLVLTTAIMKSVSTAGPSLSSIASELPRSRAPRRR